MFGESKAHNTNRLQLWGRKIQLLTISNFHTLYILQAFTASSKNKNLSFGSIIFLNIISIYSTVPQGKNRVRWFEGLIFTIVNNLAFLKHFFFYLS